MTIAEDVPEAPVRRTRAGGGSGGHLFSYKLQAKDGVRVLTEGRCRYGRHYNSRLSKKSDEWVGLRMKQGVYGRLHGERIIIDFIKSSTFRQRAEAGYFLEFNQKQKLHFTTSVICELTPVQPCINTGSLEPL